MKKILLAPIAATLLVGSVYGAEKFYGQKKEKIPSVKNSILETNKKFVITSEVFYQDHETDHFRQTKYSLADGTYTVHPLMEKLEFYLEGRAGLKTEDYRYSNGYAVTTGQETDLFFGAQVGTKYHLLDNVALATEITMFNSEASSIRKQNIEMTLNYTF